MKLLEDRTSSCHTIPFYVHLVPVRVCLVDQVMILNSFRGSSDNNLHVKPLWE